MRTLTTCIVFLLLVPAAASADITTGLVGHWPFDGNAQDASGNGNHGAANAAVQPTADRLGNLNSAYLFDGLSSRVDVPSSASLESPTTAITMAAWVRRDGWGMVGDLYNPILTKSTSTANAFMYRFIITPSGLGTAFNSWFESGSAPGTYDEGEWYHVASTWDGSTLRHYVNGSQVHMTALTTTITPDSRTLSIGSDIPGVLEIFLGALDDVRIYNRALTPLDIAELAGVTAAPVLGLGSVWLGDAFPNPIQASAVIPLRLATGTSVALEVVDARGRRVRSLLSSWLAPGGYTVPWDGRDSTGRPVASGIYFYRVKTPGVQVSKKAVVLR